ncbi:MAG: hypothetical protein ACFN9G_10840, partial [Cardiobacterium sp.]
AVFLTDFHTQAAEFAAGGFFHVGIAFFIHIRYGSSYLNLPQNGSLPRGGEPGWGQGHKF